MVKVIRFKVRTQDKEFVPGDTINGLTQRQEKSLVNKGYCDFDKAVSQKSNPRSKGKKAEVKTEKTKEKVKEEDKIKFDPDKYVEE